MAIDPQLLDQILSPSLSQNQGQNPSSSGNSFDALPPAKQQQLAQILGGNNNSTIQNTPSTIAPSTSPSLPTSTGVNQSTIIPSSIPNQSTINPNYRPGIDSPGSEFGSSASGFSQLGGNILQAANAGIQTINQGGHEIIGGVQQAASGQGVQGSQQAFGGLEDIIKGGLGTLFSPATGIINGIKDQDIKQNVSNLLNLPSWLTTSIAKWGAKQANPNLSDDQLEQFVGQPISLATNLSLLNHPEAVEEAASGATNLAGKGINAVGDATKYGISQASGLSPTTIDAALETPQALSEAQKVGIDQTKSDTFNMLKNPIDQLQQNLTENGSAYSGVRQANAPVTLPENWLNDQLAKSGLTPDSNGQLQATTTSNIRNPSDVAAVQKFYNFWNNTANAGTPMSTGEFLNMRSDLSDISKYDTTGKTAASMNFARGTRTALNDAGRDQVPGLQELDSTHADLSTKLDDVKNLIYNNDGSLKSNATNIVNNITKKGINGPLADVQKSLPDFDMNQFAQQIKVTKALEDIDLAKGQKVGSYSRILTGVGGYAAGGPIGAILGEVLTSPQTLIPILKTAGSIYGKGEDFVNAVSDKIQNGIKPTGGQASFVSNALNHAIQTGIGTNMMQNSNPSLISPQDNLTPAREQQLSQILSPISGSYSPLSEI